MHDAAFDTSKSETLVADLRVRGVWQHQVDAIFDLWVVDMNSPSYISKSPQTALQGAKGEKKRKNGSACIGH